MTDMGESADRAAGSSSGPGGPCLVCGGTGGGTIGGGAFIPCTACSGTGRVNRPGPSWLSGWRREGATVEIADGLIATGLGTQCEQAMLFAALDARDLGAKCYLCEGADITLLGDRPLGHYDMTGQCRGQHPHVAWDAASSRIDEITPAAQELALAAVDPTATWAPPGNVEPGNFAAYINPGIWRTLPVVAVALWTAGASGQGTRAAMEWLSSGQLDQMVAFCRPLAERLGRGSLPLLTITTELLQGPEGERRTAIQHAWQSLAPVEEAIRHGAQAQPLDLRSWLASPAILAVSLPPGASIAHRQTVVAMLVTAKYVAGHYASLPEPTVIWHHVDAPHPRGDGGSITGRRWLVLADGGAGFASWTAPAEAGGASGQPPWVLGFATDHSALQSASRRLGVINIPALSIGQAFLIRDAGPPVILTSTTS